MTKILITGGNGRFATEMKSRFKNKKNYIFLSKQRLNILKKDNIKKVLLKFKPRIVIHLAALSRPMILHEKDLIKSITTNIIGTSNLVVECSKLNIKIVYFSTQYVYPGLKGNYSEKSALLPMNNYTWSKLGGECAVQMYSNSLILRIAMSEKPWIHKLAYKNVKTNFLYHDEVIKILPRLLAKKGIINVGSDNNSIIKFAKKTNNFVKVTNYVQKEGQPIIPKDSSMNIKKLKNILKKN